MMSRAGYFLRETWINTRRNLTLTVAAILTVAVCVMLVGLGLMARYASTNALGRWQGGVQFEIFMHPDISGDQIDALGQELSIHPDIENFQLLTQDDAYVLLQEMLADDPDLVNEVSPDSLPPSYRVVPVEADGDLIESLASQFRQRPGVYSVETGRQQVDAIKEWFNSFRWIVLLMSVVLSIASVMLIFNTIRVAMFARRREIEVMKLVGATNSFIRLPFVLEGMIHGLLGGVLGAVAAGFLRNHVEDLFSRSEILAFFQSFTVTNGQFNTVAIMTVIAGVVVGALGSAFAAGRFLDV
ncbi:MAG: cell division transport system permease protein [Candidatus Poriferisodalaceae bacterium]|jgi:cell division transport system permease protein